MEWVWLILSVVGLGLLWLLILAMDKLTLRLKEHDEARKITVKNIKRRTEEAEADFLEKQQAKADAKEFIETADFSDATDDETEELLKEAIDTLSSQELVQAVAKRVFGSPESTDVITAQQSAFDEVRSKRVVAKGDGITPVKVKSASKSELSKAEQKMLKKIKQGD